MQNEIFKVTQDFAEGSAPIWKAAGCKPACVDTCVSDLKSYLKHGCSHCECKQLIKVNVNAAQANFEQFTEVDFANLKDEEKIE